MKARKIILIIILSLFILLLIAAAALLIAVQDGTDQTPQAIREADEPLEKLLSETVTVSLSDITDDPDVSVDLDGVTINRYLFSILTHLKNLGLLSFRGAYCVFEQDGALHVEIPSTFSGVQTCLIATAYLENSGEILKITLKNAKLGHFDCTNWFIRAFILTDGLGRKLERALRDIGLETHIDMNSLTITTSHSDISNMIGHLTEEDPNAPLYRVISDLCLETPELLEIQTLKDRISVVLHTQVMTYDPSRDGTILYPLDIESVRPSVEGFEGLSYENVTLLYNGFIIGYDDLSDDNKQKADEMGLRYRMKGIREASAADISMALIKQKPNLPLTELILKGSYSVRIESDTAAAIIANLPFVGSTIGFTDGQNSAYICLESMEMIFSENHLRIRGILNVSGRRICLDIQGSCSPGTGEKLSVGVTSLAFGSHVLKDSYIPDILAYLASVLAEETWIEPVPNERLIVLDLASILETIDGFQAVRKNCENAVISLEDDCLKITWPILK